ncbi:MAG TPA: dTDP-4-dehydrorhamnose reductase [Beijerinckiaceae bacterium]|nr:dTDP-4-dehydrorhamnose reductase [Beijerinckiaceae bacterium]
MRLIVTGRDGQVARALMAEAPALGVILIPLGRPELDLLHPTGLDALFAAHRPDGIINAAAYTAVDQAENDYDAALAVNGAGAGAVATAAAALNIPIIQLSTDYVFDGTKPTPYIENDPVAPINAYGRSKLAGERSVIDATPNHAILRTSWVYAATGKNFVLTMLRLAADRSSVTVVSDQRGAPSYAPDIARAVLDVARNLATRPDDALLRGIFHMTGGGETSWAEFATEIFRQSAARGGPSAAVTPVPTSAFPTPARRPANSRLDCGRLKTVHGVALPDWRDGLGRCMDTIWAHR